jgi:Cu/Ag efflux protein CusF
MKNNDVTDFTHANYVTNQQGGGSVMKKYIFILLVVLVAGLAAVAVILKAGEGATQEPEFKTHVGEVVSVDTAQNQIVIKHDTGEAMTLLIGADTEITKDGEAITLADVQAGDHVSSEVDELTGRCKLIQVLPVQTNIF